MTNVTKTEKILRKATGKWSKFLAEGAFNGQEEISYYNDMAGGEPDRRPQKTAAEHGWKEGDKADIIKGEYKGAIGTVIDVSGSDLVMRLDNGQEVAVSPRYSVQLEETQVNEMTMGERGMQDAQDGNPPSKIGGGLEDYMSAYNAVMQKMGKEPLPIVQPDQAYLDALSRGNLEEQEEQGFQVGEFVYIVSGGLRGATGKIAEPTTLVTGEQGYVIHLYSDADKKVFGKQGDEVIAGASRIKSGGTFDGSELYDIDETASGREQSYLKQQNIAKGAAMALFHAAGGEGTTTPGPFVKQQANIIVAAMVELERMILPMAELDERSEDDERDLEKPVKYGSGAELEFDRKTGKFYDRKRDMYIDDKEADALIKESVRKALSSKKKVKSVKENSPLPSATRVKYSSDPEMNQVMRIAAEMLEMPSRSRGTITLKSVQSALEAHSIDSVIENDMIIVDNKYVIAKKVLLPKTAQKISFTVYAADYLSNLQGEQQNFPMQ